MKTERHVEFFYLVSGHVIQSIVLTDESVSPDELMELLNSGDATTSVIEGQDVIVWKGVANPKVIGYVNSTVPELDSEEFDIIQVTDFPVELPKQFPISRMALSFAIGEYVSNETLSTTTEIMKILEQAGDAQPPLAVLQQHSGLSGNQLLEEIKLTESGIKNIMEYSYSAGARGEEMV